MICYVFDWLQSCLLLLLYYYYYYLLVYTCISSPSDLGVSDDAKTGSLACEGWVSLSLALAVV